MNDQVTQTPRISPPVPSSVSAEAQAFLGLPTRFGDDIRPDLDDIDGWIRWIDEKNAEIQAVLSERLPAEGMLERSEVEIDGVPTYVLRPGDLADNDELPIFLDFHGGGLVLCAGDPGWMMSARRAVDRGGLTYVPDFRNPPQHPYPAALDDCLAVYRWAIKARTPSKVVVFGESGGANLAAAVLLRARDEGLPMPAALSLLTPHLDLTESGDSFYTNLGIDYLGSPMQQSLLYANGHDLSDPYLSPLFGDLTGFPPTFLQTGTRDLLLSNTVRMHRRLLAAGVEVELHVFEAMPHGSFGGQAPEDLELISEVMRFERQHLAAAESPVAK